MIELRPSDILYSQDSISNRFKCHVRFIGETLDKLLSGSINIDDIPAISVVLKHERYYSVDNRRLWVFKKAEELGYLETIKVKRTSYYYQFESKFTTKNDGISVRIRGGDPGGSIWRNWKSNKNQYSKHYRLNKSSLSVEDTCEDEQTVCIRHRDIVKPVWRSWTVFSAPSLANRGIIRVQDPPENRKSVSSQDKERDESNTQSDQSSNNKVRLPIRSSKRSFRVQSPYYEKERRILAQMQCKRMIDIFDKKLMHTAQRRDVRDSMKENGSQRVGYYNSRPKSSFSTYMQSNLTVENHYRAEEKTQLQECSNTKQVFVGCNCGIECRILKIRETKPCYLWTSRLREVGGLECIQNT